MQCLLADTYQVKMTEEKHKAVYGFCHYTYFISILLIRENHKEINLY